MEKLDILATAKSVIKAEREGLALTESFLDESFERAVNLMQNATGHVVVTGMGKPGHIAKKISATLASTGTKSFFLHPAEASHGDLGMLATDDLLLAFSFSGETSELIPMLSYAKRFSIPVIGVTANKDSLLAKASTVMILIPKVNEATPNNLAPTTSSTIMLAVGDAISVCLLKLKNFGKEEFRRLHPGGSLGKKLLKVSDLMHKNMPLVSENDSMKDVIIEMTAMAFGCAGVIDQNGNLTGIITDGDLRRNINNILDRNASDVMTRNPKIINIDTFAVEAMKFLNDSKITSLFVVNEGFRKPCGILHIHDCFAAGLC